MRRLFCIMFIFLLFLTTGCWDKEEIEQRLFVIEIGIDVYQNEGENNTDRLTVTYQYPNINAIGKNAGSGPSNFLLTANSSSVFQTGRHFMSKVAFPFHFKHLKVIILGRDFLREDELMRSVLDELNRDTKINKRVRILASDRKAVEILEASHTMEQRIEGTIYSTVRDNRHTSSFTVKALTDLITDFDIAGVTIVPRVTLDENNKFMVSGGCILKDYRFLDWVNAEENKIINLINGDVALETIDVEYNGNIISYAITSSSTKRNVDVGDKITANINIEVEGYLQGYILNNKKNVEDVKTVLEMEKSIEDEMNKMINQTVSHIKEIKADLIGIGEHLSKFHPKVWEKIRDNWDDIFSDIEFNINVDAKIRRIGLTK